MRVETQPLLDDTMNSTPKAPWAAALPSSRNPTRYMPQTIAHRGYKAAFPENTMAGFKGALAVGAHALETDLHLSKDGVVVLSHDAGLKRCYGVDKKIEDCEWEYLSTLETVREPKQTMPRLKDLLVWLNGSGREHLWIVLDVKIDDEAGELLSAVARTIKDVPGTKSWDQRIVIGCWNATFIKAARTYLSSFPIVHISFYLPYTRHFLPIPNLGFNIFQRALVGYPGGRFLREAKRHDRPVYAWTVNDEYWMEWCIRKNIPEPKSTTDKSLAEKYIDGVITDDPKKFLEVCEKVEDEMDGKAVVQVRKGATGHVKKWSRLAMQMLVFEIFSRLFFVLARWKGRFDYPHEMKQKDEEKKTT